MSVNSGTSNGVHAGEFPWDVRSPDDAPIIPEPELSFAQRIADKTTIVLGSWMFIFIQLVVVGVWILLNMLAFVQHWDPYPFIFLNLAFSFQSAIVAPIILMSQNRQDETDRIRDQAEFAVNTRAGRNVRQVRAQVETLTEQQAAAFQALQAQQDELLRRLDALTREVQSTSQRVSR